MSVVLLSPSSFSDNFTFRKYSGEEEEDGDEEDVIELDLFGHPDAKLGPGADPDEKCSLVGNDARKLKMSYQKKSSRMLPLIEGKFRGETFAIKPGYWYVAV